MAVPADREVGAERHLRRALRTAYRDLPFASVRRRLLVFGELLAQAFGCLLQREAPVIQHVEIVGGPNRAGAMIEVGVLVRVQPDHFAERQQQAEREHGYRRGLPAAAVFLEPVHPPREGGACEHRHRRNHKDEMPDTVVKRRTLHHRNGQRQRCRKRQHQKNGLAAGRYIGARQRPLER